MNRALPVLSALVILGCAALCVTAIATMLRHADDTTGIDPSEEFGPASAAGRTRTIGPPAPVPRDPADAIVSPIVVDPGSHTFRVVIAVSRDAGFSRADDSALRFAVESASGEFEKAFGVRFEVAGLVEWKSSDADDRSIVEEHRALVERVTPPRGALVIGFGAEPALGGDRGYAPYYGAHVLVCVHPKDSAWRFAKEIVAHEVGHVFGAWHVRESGSMMRPGCIDEPLSAFDPVSSAVIRIGLADAGVAGADVTDVVRESELAALFRGNHARGEPFPLIWVFSRRARAAGTLDPVRRDRLADRARDLTRRTGLTSWNR